MDGNDYHAFRKYCIPCAAKPLRFAAYLMLLGALTAMTAPIAHAAGEQDAAKNSGWGAAKEVPLTELTKEDASAASKELKNTRLSCSTDFSTLPDPVYAAFDANCYVRARELAEAAAAKDNAQAHTLLGQIYEQGLSVAQDSNKAAEYYAKGAKLGDVHSQFALAVMLTEGRGIKRDKKLAVHFYEMAAEKNHAVALYNLALLYVAGDDVAEDLNKAAKLMEKAASLDHAAAQYDLAAFYKEGAGVPQSDTKSTYWLGRAAEGGYTNAELEYGIALFNGKGVAKNEKAGIVMIQRAAEKGNPLAQNRLAHAFARGAGVKQNAVEAVKWHILARDSGVDDFNLDLLTGAVTKDERTKAERSAYDYQQATDALLQ